MDNRLQSTLNLVDKLRGLHCPVCGKSPQITVTSATSYNISVCHQELGDLCDKTEQAFINAGKEQGYKTIKIKPRTPPAL
jgi:hypothetical protein